MSASAPAQLGPAEQRDLRALRERLGATRLADRHRLGRELDRLHRPHPGRDFTRALGRVAAGIESSAARVERLRTAPVRLEYDPALPITSHRAEILAALEAHRVIVVAGATGSGKSTQLPKLCLEAGRGALGLVGHTQPRRIAARALAARLAEETGTSLGTTVGYQVRFNDRTGPDTRIKLMTDGILLKELEGDLGLLRYDTLIIDEAHERSLNIDLLLGVLQRLVRERDDLKVIVTSATIEPARFASFFGGAPVVEVSGRSYPVEVRYRPLQDEEADAAELSLPEGVVGAVRELDATLAGEPGDVLVFLPGEKQIREAADALERARLPGTEVLPLYARLSTRDQERIFEPHARRRVVLATNVAETSLTVPGVRCVVDSGLVRISRYSVRGKVQRLPIEPISRASADQRKGRCGREAEGVCIRLYSESDYAERPEFTPPEVVRTNLASVILKIAALGLGDPETFPFLDPPDTRLVNDGIRLLQELQAMDDERRITKLGRQLASLPVDPRLGRMLLAAARHDCVDEMLIVAAFLAAQDPRERPQDAQRQADEKHAAFADVRSDFVTALNIWRMYGLQAESLSGNQLKKWCRENYLSVLRMREWQELHSQLSDAAADLELPRNATPASYSALHRAILPGFLGSIGHLHEKREYEGARGTHFVIAPGTPLASRTPRWVVAASLVETTRLYARMVAAVQPDWIEAAAGHLLRRTYSEAHWWSERAHVAARETVMLYGLTLSANRRVNYGAIAPREAHEIFIREALVEGRADVRGEFIESNRRLKRGIELLEAKVRRRDILVDEQAQVEFYRACIPERISSMSAFERWRTQAERERPGLLTMGPGDLMRREAPEAGPDRYPDEFEIGANSLPLRYRFDPDAPDDGVTLVVPALLLPMVPADRLGWLVPGLHLEKVVAVLRALPKPIRVRFVPVPDHARLALEEAFGTGTDATRTPTPAGFNEWMSLWITRHAGTRVTAADVAALSIPDALRMNVRVVDDADHVVAEGRDLAVVRRRLGAAAAAATPAQAPMPAGVHREWDFGDVPAERVVARDRLRLTLFPAIEDTGAGVRLVEARSLADAERLSRQGVLRLALLALPQQARYVRRRFAENARLALLAQGLELGAPVADALTTRAFAEALLPNGAALPRTRTAFEALVDAGRAGLAEAADRLAASFATILVEWRTLRATLHGMRSPAFAALVADVHAQLDGLFPPDLLERTPRESLEQYPRYLKAVARRLERAAGNVRRDDEQARRLAPYVEGLATLRAAPGTTGARPELERLRWMIEEFRVQLFAQELKTSMRVSEKRLDEQLLLARMEAAG